MTTAKEALWQTFEGLTREQFELFKWFLMQGDEDSGFPAISMARLEDANRQDTIDQMVQKYGNSGAVRLTVKILVKISRNDLVQALTNTSSKLSEKLKEGKSMKI